MGSIIKKIIKEELDFDWADDVPEKSNLNGVVFRAQGEEDGLDYTIIDGGGDKVNVVWGLVGDDGVEYDRDSIESYFESGEFYRV